MGSTHLLICLLNPWPQVTEQGDHRKESSQRPLHFLLKHVRRIAMQRENFFFIAASTAVLHSLLLVTVPALSHFPWQIPFVQGPQLLQLVGLHLRRSMTGPTARQSLSEGGPPDKFLQNRRLVCIPGPQGAVHLVQGSHWLYSTRHGCKPQSSMTL